MDSIEELPKNKYKVTSYANFLTGINSIGRKKCTTVIESKYDLKKMEENKHDVANVVWNDLITNGHRMLGDVEVASIKLMKKRQRGACPAILTTTLKLRVDLS